MDETGVLGLLEELSILLEDAKPVFGKNNLRQVDVSAAFEIIDEIRDTFPSEFAQSRQIVRISQQQADTILADARELERQTRAGAEDYADEVFGHVEQSLDTLLGNVRRCRDRLNAGSTNVGRG